MSGLCGFLAGGIFGLVVGVITASAIFIEREDKK